MKLTKLGIIFFITLFTAFAVNVFMVLQINDSFKSAHNAEEKRFESIKKTYLIERDLQQLNWFVLTFATSKEIKYLKYYFDLHKIIDGKMAPPEDYIENYWSRVVAGTIPHQVSNQKGKSIEEIFLEFETIQNDRSKLDLLLEYSKKMKMAELQVFSATQGMASVETGEFDDEAAAEWEKATKFVHSDEYLKLKSEYINVLLAIFIQIYEDLDQQVNESLENMEQSVQHAIMTAIISIIFMLIIGYYVRRDLVQPLFELVTSAEHFGHGDYKQRIHFNHAVKEVTELSDTFNDMAQNIENDITRRQELMDDLENAKNTIEQAHFHTQQSIEYASIIQSALLPDRALYTQALKESFIYWKPKDIVGGDVYGLAEMRTPREYLMFVTDCTGHGVPGAFVSMLVKAVKQDVLAQAKASKEEVISPAMILSWFNQTLKKLLKQDHPEVDQNAGFDGAVVYFNYDTNTCLFAGAETNLYIVNPNEKTQIIKGDRQSIGYKKSKTDFVFTDHSIDMQSDARFYITTDGYVDQIGGHKSFPFGKRKFATLLAEIAEKPMSEQEQILEQNLIDYQGDNHERVDDVTVLGFRF